MKQLTPAQRKQAAKMLATLEAMSARNKQLIDMLDRRERIPESMLQPIK